MKKISLEVYNFASSLRIMAHLLLKIGDLPSIPIRAIVDTGSPVTILGMPDLKRMKVSQLQLRNLESRKEPHAYGGGQLKTKILRDADLRLGEHFECKMDVQIWITALVI